MAFRTVPTTKAYSRKNQVYGQGSSGGGRPTIEIYPGNDHSSQSPQSTGGGHPHPKLQDTQSQSNLQQGLAVMCNNVTLIERNLKKVKGVVASMLEWVDISTTCSVCWCRFRDPFVTDCGHVFCLDCILSWLETQMKDLLEEDVGSALGTHIIDAIRDPLLDPKAFINAAGVVDALELQFCCPLCRSVLKKRPIPAVAIEAVARELGMSSGGEGEAATEEWLCRANKSFEQYLLF